MYNRKSKPYWFAQADRTEALIEMGAVTVKELASELGLVHQAVYLYVTTRKKEPRADMAFRIQEFTEKLMSLHAGNHTGQLAYRKALKKIQKKHL